MAVVTFIVGEISSPLLSLGRLLPSGCSIGGNSNELYLMKGSASVPLIIRRSSLCVYARFVDCVSLEGKNGYVEESDSVIVAPLTHGGASGSNEPAATAPAAEPLAPAAVLDDALPISSLQLCLDAVVLQALLFLNLQTCPKCRLRAVDRHVELSKACTKIINS